MSKADPQQMTEGHPATATVGDDRPLEELAFAAVQTDTPPVEDQQGADTGNVTIRDDITGQSTSTGELSEFTRLFRDRFDTLSSLLSKRNFDHPERGLDDITDKSEGDQVTVIGMVFDKWTSRNNHQMLSLDSPSGNTKVIATDEELKEKCTRLLTDEVVAIEGTVAGEGAVFANEIYHPDVPVTNTPSTAGREVKAVLASDFHFGSKDFSAERWQEFVAWMHTREDIEYLVCAGDLVEGIGVYPGQKDELLIERIEEQYELAAEGLSQLPDRLNIISIVGNHDSIRLAEPQPALPERFEQYFDDNVTIVGNPAYIEIEGVTFLDYHGMSLDGVIAALPDASYQQPEKAMEYYLEKRHLAPKWGDKVRLAPEEEDYLTIDTVPDVLHCGHVHKFGTSEYRGVRVINSGTWQEQTDFQQSKGIIPDVGYAPVIELSNLELTVEQF